MILLYTIRRMYAIGKWKIWQKNNHFSTVYWIVYNKKCLSSVYGGTLILAENIYELNVKVQELEDKIVE